MNENHDPENNSFNLDDTGQANDSSNVVEDTGEAMCGTLCLFKIE
jgi:hypothetical protein